MPDGELDDFIQRTVERVCPAPLVVSDTALRQLRPVFEELLELRVAVEDIAMLYDAAWQEQELWRSVGDAICAARAKLKGGA